MHTEANPKSKPLPKSIDRPARRKAPQTHTGWHPEDIKAALKKAGSSQVDIARQLSVCTSAVAHIVAGRETGRRIADAIAAKIGKPLSELWPGRYD